MGRLARVLSFLNVTRRNAKVGDVKIDGGGGANVTAEHFGPAGDASRPLPDDYAVVTKIDGEGREVAVGYLDPKGPQDAAPGDKYIYSRDANGVLKAKVWLKNTGDVVIANDDATVTLGADGTIGASNSASSLSLGADGAVSLTNGVGTVAIDAAGNVNINGVVIDVAGNITTPAAVNAAAVNAGAVAATGAGGINSAGPVSGTDLTASNAVNGAVANITGAVNAGSVSSTGAVTGAGNTLHTHTHPAVGAPPTPGT